MSDLTVPDEYDDWPFDARKFVLAEANSAMEIREAIASHVGLSCEDVERGRENQFTKDEMAAILMALGGPEGR